MDANTKADDQLIGMPRHPIWVRTDGTISIGCQRHSLDHWLVNYQAIGHCNFYEDTEIQLYGKKLRSLARGKTKRSTKK
jgi:hypothetical protein